MKLNEVARITFKWRGGCFKCKKRDASRLVRSLAPYSNFDYETTWCASGLDQWFKVYRADGTLRVTSFDMVLVTSNSKEVGGAYRITTRALSSQFSPPQVYLSGDELYQYIGLHWYEAAHAAVSRLPRGTYLHVYLETDKD